MTVVLLLGSGPNVVKSKSWERRHFDRIVTINNAWQVRSDWDDLVYPWDFPQSRMPHDIANKSLISQELFVPAQNAYGGFVYAGGTMAFTAAYWALNAYRPRVIATMGCDMHYPSGQTHFYGTGTADPLRDDITLQSLEAKSARLMVLAARQGCAMVNMSDGPSRLVFPRVQLENLAETQPAPYDKPATQQAQERELDLNYYVPSGRYWQELERFDAAALRDLDALWLRAAGCC
jgi:hypothetical protein